MVAAIAVASVGLGLMDWALWALAASLQLPNAPSPLTVLGGAVASWSGSSACSSGRSTLRSDRSASPSGCPPARTIPAFAADLTPRDPRSDLAAPEVLALLRMFGAIAAGSGPAALIVCGRSGGSLSQCCATQNSLPSGSVFEVAAVPQRGQADDIGVPHSTQDLPPGRLSAPQRAPVTRLPRWRRAGADRVADAHVDGPLG